MVSSLGLPTNEGRSIWDDPSGEIHLNRYLFINNGVCEINLSIVSLRGKTNN